MTLTVRRQFVNKSSPGNWLYAKMGDLAKTGKYTGIGVFTGFSAGPLFLFSEKR